MGLILQYVSIFVELTIALIGLLIVFQKKKKYGWFIFLTFFIYVFYDSSKIFGSILNSRFWNLMFLIATISAWFGVWNIYKENLIKKEKKIIKRGKKK